MKSDSMQKTQFLKELKMLADDLYSFGDSHEPSEIWKQKSSFLDGFVKAGSLFKIASMSEIQEVIDTSHFRTFGEDREARSMRRKSEQVEPEEHNWDSYDSPSFTRRKQ